MISVSCVIKFSVDQAIDLSIYLSIFLSVGVDCISYFLKFLKQQTKVPLESHQTYKTYLKTPEYLVSPVKLTIISEG